MTRVPLNRAYEATQDMRDRLEKSTAEIAVQFRSDQIKLTRNKDGAVIEGDPSTVQSVTDRWTFERDLGSRNPNWVLVATHGPA